jgi:NifU-like protein
MSDTAEDLRRNAVAAALAELRPALRAHGGDCELVEVDGNRVVVRLAGACVGCQLASATLGGIQDRLARSLGPGLRVVPAGAAR